MAEALAALGTVASIVQLVDLGFRLTVKLSLFAASIGSAAESITRVSGDVAVVSAALRRLHDALSAEQDPLTDVGAGELRNVIRQCEGIFEDIYELVDQSHGAGKGKQSMGTRIKSAFNKISLPAIEGKLLKYSSQLGASKSSIMLLLLVHDFSKSRLSGEDDVDLAAAKTVLDEVYPLPFREAANDHTVQPGQPPSPGTGYHTTGMNTLLPPDTGSVTASQPAIVGIKLNAVNRPVPPVAAPSKPSVEPTAVWQLNALDCVLQKESGVVITPLTHKGHDVSAFVTEHKAGSYTALQRRLAAVDRDIHDAAVEHAAKRGHQMAAFRSEQKVAFLRFGVVAEGPCVTFVTQPSIEHASLARPLDDEDDMPSPHYYHSAVRGKESDAIRQKVKDLPSYAFSTSGTPHVRSRPLSWAKEPPRPEEEDSPPDPLVERLRSSDIPVTPPLTFNDGSLAARADQSKSRDPVQAGPPPDEMMSWSAPDPRAVLSYASNTRMSTSATAAQPSPSEEGPASEPEHSSAGAEVGTPASLRASESCGAFDFNAFGCDDPDVKYGAVEQMQTSAGFEALDELGCDASEEERETMTSLEALRKLWLR